MGRKHQTVPRDDTTQKLKDKVRRLESDKRKLIAELKTLQDAFDKSRQFINKKVQDISVETLTKMSDKTLKQIEAAVTCKKCGSTKQMSIRLPNGKTVNACTECNHREPNDDSSQFDSVEEVV